MAGTSVSAPVFADLVGQEKVVETLQGAVDGAMTHAWLFTGPPGSGRSNAAVAFATALQCPEGGCGRCRSCVSAAEGTHPDISVINTALHPATGRYQVLIIEDADRLTDQAANALLKAIEEPTPHTLWMLCAPASEDVITTIRSRCRSVVLRTPSTRAIAQLLVERDGVDPDVARAVAAASQGHIGRARGLARDPERRARRAEILSLPVRLRTIGDCFTQARSIDAEATERARDHCDVADAQELADLRAAYGVEERGKRPAGYASALATLTKDQERRRKRMARDAIDGVLLDILSFLRDVIARQIAPGTAAVNGDVEEQIDTIARSWSTDRTWRAIAAVTQCREALQANAAPLVALENMLVRFMS